MLYKRGTIIELVLLAVITAGSTQAIGAEHATLVIRGGTLFDAVRGVMIPDRTIVIVGGRIQATGSPQQRVKIPARVRVLDARGKYLVPGLIDAHAHVAIVWDFAHLTSEESLPHYLANGVTSLRDVGDDIIAEKLLARYAEAHPDLCPRIFLCSPLIEGDPPFHPNLGWNAVITDPAEVPAFVDKMAGWGVVTLKIYVKTERAVGRKVIEEGHRRGMTITGHLSKYSPLEAAEDGIDSLEHISAGSLYGFLSSQMTAAGADVDLSSPIVQKLIAVLVKHKVMVDPTLVCFRNMLLLPDLPGVIENPDNAWVPESLKKFWPTYATRVQPETLERRMEEFKKYQELTGLLFRAGVPLLAGTDAPEPYVPPGFSLHQELELLVESGLAPAAALQAATINNARALKQEEELGSIEEGKVADLVILDANPLADIKNTRKIYKVIRGGLILDPTVLLKTAPGKR